MDFGGKECSDVEKKDSGHRLEEHEENGEIWVRVQDDFVYEYHLPQRQIVLLFYTQHSLTMRAATI